MLPSSADFRRRALPIAASQAIGVGCGILGVKIVSHWIPPAVLGGYGVYLTFTTLGMWLVHLGLTKFLNREWAAAPDRTALLRVVTKEWIRKLTWLAAAAGAATVAMSRATDVAWYIVFPLLFVSAAMLSIFALAQGALQAERAHWADFLVSGVASLGRTFLPPVLYVAAHRSPTFLYVGFVLHAVSAALVGAWMLRRHWNSPRQKPHGSPAIRPIYLGPLFSVLAAASWTLYGLNRWVVAAFFGDHAAGLFTLSANMAALIPTVLGAMFLQYFQPGLYSLSDTNPPDVRARLLRRVDGIIAALGLVGLAAVLFLRAVAPSLMGFLIAETYRDGLQWIIPSGCFALAIATNQFFHVMLLAARQERACGIVDLTTAGVLTSAAIGGALVSAQAFWWALTLTPLCTWLVTRTLAHAVFRRTPAEGAAP